MPGQSLLEGVAPVPPATDRLFFAIYPDPPAAACIAQLARQLRGELGLTGRPPGANRFHVTLYCLGDFLGVPDAVVAAAGQVAPTLAAPPFEIAFDRAASFVGKPLNRPFVLLGGDGVVALKRFRQALVRTLGRGGRPQRAELPFTPHLTLLYDARRVDERPIETIAWTARELVLVRSLLGRSRHEALGRWPMRG